MSKIHRFAWSLCVLFFLLYFLGLFIKEIPSGAIPTGAVDEFSSPWYTFGSVLTIFSLLGELVFFPVAMLLGINFTSRNGRLRMLETAGFMFLLLLLVQFVVEAQVFKPENYYVPTTLYDRTLLQLSFYMYPMLGAIIPVALISVIMSALRKFRHRKPLQPKVK